MESDLKTKTEIALQPRCQIKNKNHSEKWWSLLQSKMHVEETIVI